MPTYKITRCPRTLPTLTAAKTSHPIINNNDLKRYIVNPEKEKRTDETRRIKKKQNYILKH
jgi:hypothetical protein